MRRTLAVVGLCLALAAVAQAQDDPAKRAAAAAAVPVKAVVLFSSGVGYFEHSGTVNGEAQTELRFKAEQVNDLLKSLVLQDLDGGRIGTITYPSHDPVEKTLRSFEVDITGNPSLADLLNQLRGAKVKISAHGQEISGTILGVEKKQRPIGPEDKVAVEVAVLNVFAGGTIRSVMLDDVQSLELEDRQLQEELAGALSALAQARGQDKKPVQISFRGEGERRVRLGYVVETPVWKTSYRLILRTPEKEGDEKNGAAKPQAADGALQGWAIVENQTDNDWEDVQLSLVSGRPISFVMNLYEPLYIARPVVEPELYASLRPQRYEAGLREEAQRDMAVQPERERGMMARRVPAAAAPGQAQDAVSGVALEASRIDPTASIASVASAAQIGELFQYTIGNVSLPRQRSAMLPIITDDVEVEKLSIYRASVLQQHPLNGARIHNTTGKHLLAGPITVLEHNSYAGDAQIDHLPPGQERLISYGIDLEMRIDSTKNRQESAIQTGRIVKGVLHITRRHVHTQEYLAQNKGEREKQLIVEHPLRRGWKLVETPDPIETTESLYRFRQPLPAGKEAKLVVKEQHVALEHFAILPADLGQIEMYSRSGEFPPAVREALIEAMRRKGALVSIQREIQRREQQIAELTSDQPRIRDNMKTIPPNSDC
jgi:hypothetical protein